jgi:hypothetical protein
MYKLFEGVISKEQQLPTWLPSGTIFDIFDIIPENISAIIRYIMNSIQMELQPHGISCKVNNFFISEVSAAVISPFVL